MELFRSVLLIGSLLACILSSGCGLLLGSSAKVDRKSHDYKVANLDRRYPDRWHLAKQENHEVSRAKPEKTNGTTNNFKDDVQDDVKDSVKDSVRDGFNEEIDLVYENINTGAVISLNSICNEAERSNETAHDLELRLNSLVMGTAESIEKIEKSLVQIDGKKALQAIYISGGRSISESGWSSQTKIHAVVTYFQGCTYDFLYVSTANNFNSGAEDFRQFLAEFHVNR